MPPLYIETPPGHRIAECTAMLYDCYSGTVTRHEGEAVKYEAIQRRATMSPLRSVQSYL